MIQANKNIKCYQQPPTSCRTSQYSAVKDSEYMTRWKGEETQFVYRQRQNILSFLNHPDRLFPAPGQAVPRYLSMREAERLPPSGAEVKNKWTIRPLSHLPSRREWRRSYLYVGNKLPDYTVSHLRHQYKHKQKYLTQRTFPVMYWCVLPDYGRMERPKLQKGE